MSFFISLAINQIFPYRELSTKRQITLVKNSVRLRSYILLYYNRYTDNILINSDLSYDKNLDLKSVQCLFLYGSSRSYKYVSQFKMETYCFADRWGFIQATTECYIPLQPV